MKRYSIFMMLVMAAVLAFTSGCSSSKSQKDPEAALQDSLANIVANKLVDQRDFVLTASRITLGNSPMIQVFDNMNFIYVNGDDCTLQLSFNNANFPPFTAKGTVSNYSVTRGKKGETTVRFRFNGRLGTADVNIILYKDSNQATAYVDATFRRGRCTFYGELKPTSRQVIEIRKEAE